MKKQHWGLAWCLAALCCVPAAAAATVLERISAGGKLVIAHRESAVPFSYVASGKPVGYAVDLCLRLAEEWCARRRAPRTWRWSSSWSPPPTASK